jgi:outer membrane PBP1 activator LpoA protein
MDWRIIMKIVLSIITLLTIILSACGTSLSTSHENTSANPDQVETDESANLTSQSSSNEEVSYHLEAVASCCPPLEKEEAQKLVEKIHGVTKVEVSGNLEVKVWYNTKETSPNKIEMQILQATGYSVKEQTEE